MSSLSGFIIPHYRRRRRRAHAGRATLMSNDAHTHAHAAVVDQVPQLTWEDFFTDGNSWGQFN